MLKAGNEILGGVNAHSAGTTVAHKDCDGNDVELPVLGSVAEAIEKAGTDVAIIFVAPKFAKDAIIEAIDAQTGLRVVTTPASITGPGRIGLVCKSGTVTYQRPIR